MIQRIDNVGVAVSDLERSVAFYEALGFSVESRDETPAATLAAGEARMWVFQTTAAERDAGRRPELVGNRPGLDHLSFWVGDVDAAAEQARGAGLQLESAPADQEWGYRAASLLDPDGNRVFLLGDRRG